MLEPQAVIARWSHDASIPDWRSFQPCHWSADGQSDILEQVELPLRGAEEHRMDVEAWLQSLGLERYVRNN